MTTNTKLRNLMVELAKTNRELTNAKARVDDLKAKVLAELEANDVTTHNIKRQDGTSITVTRVQAHSLVFDDARLRASLTATQWNSITKKVLDRAKLEKAVAEQEIDPMVVANASTEVAGKPYVKITVK